MATEIFNYSNVSTEMSKIDACRSSIRTTLSSGSTAIETAFTKGSGSVALAGVSAEVIKSKWDELSENFTKFDNYITRIEEKMDAASKNDQALEEVLAMKIGG